VLSARDVLAPGAEDKDLHRHDTPFSRQFTAVAR